MCAVAYMILAYVFIASEGPNSELAVAFNRDYKGEVSLAIYLVAIALSLVSNWLALALYGVVALIWFMASEFMNRARKQAGHNAQGNVELFSQLQRPACLRARFMNSEAGLGIIPDSRIEKRGALAIGQQLSVSFGQIQLFVNFSERQFEFDAGQLQDIRAARVNAPTPIFARIVAAEMLDKNAFGVH